MTDVQQSAVLERIGAIDSLDQLNEEAAGFHVTPGWSDRAKPIFRQMERSAYTPALWRYNEMRATLDRASKLIDIELADRRNLVLCNPRPGDDWATTQTLVSAFQMIMPGEKARSHRHSSNAMRVIIEGKGTYSTVEGEKVPMETGDVVLTPGGLYHGHGHEGDEPAYWFDCLDVPLTRLFETNYHLNHPEGYETITRVVEKSPFRFAREDIARALDGTTPSGEAHRGIRVILDTASMPSFGLAVERLASGSRTVRWRSSANRVYSVMEGSGVSRIDGVDMRWTRGDAFIVPAKYWVEHHANEDAQLLEMTDEPLVKFANHYVEEFS